MPSGLAHATQEDFSAGMWRSVARHLISSRGVYTLRNLLLDDDGSAYKRGGSVYRSNAAFGTKVPFLWDGLLTVGQRTVFASPTGFGVLDADEATPRALGGPGLSAPAQATLVGDVLVVDGGFMYGGSRKTASYGGAGGRTLGVTGGSAVVTGAGTTAFSNVDAGMLLQVSPGERYYVVKSVDSSTQVTLTEPYAGSTASGLTSWSFVRLATLGAPYVSAGVYAMAGDRLLAADRDGVRFTDGRDPATGYLRLHSWPTLSRHELAGAGAVLGMRPLRGGVVVFTAGGVWVISNLAFNLIDATGNPQQSVQRLSTDLVLWGGNASIVSWSNALIVPALDGVYLVDGVSAPVPLSGSIEGLYRDYVRAGYKPGGAAVYRNHLFLPILDGASTWIDTLVCRLDRPVPNTRLGTIFPWVQLDGHAANVGQLVPRVDSAGASAPRLLAGGLGADARVLDLAKVFEPSSAVKADADGSAIEWELEDRDVASGGGNLNHVRRVALRYEMDTEDAATIEARYSVGTPESTSTSVWGGMAWGSGAWGDASLTDFTALPGLAGASDGRNPFTWLFDRARRTRFIRSRFSSSGKANRVVIRSITYFIRPARRDR